MILCLRGGKKCQFPRENWHGFCCYLCFSSCVGGCGCDGAGRDAGGRGAELCRCCCQLLNFACSFCWCCAFSCTGGAGLTSGCPPPGAAGGCGTERAVVAGSAGRAGSAGWVAPGREAFGGAAGCSFAELGGVCGRAGGLAGGCGLAAGCPGRGGSFAVRAGVCGCPGASVRTFGAAACRCSNDGRGAGGCLTATTCRFITAADGFAAVGRPTPITLARAGCAGML